MAKSSDKRASEPDEGGESPPGGKPHTAPRIVAPSNRVNVAFPFSRSRLQEPTKELTDLAAVVVDLVAALAEWIPEEQLAELRGRAQAVHDRLR